MAVRPLTLVSLCDGYAGTELALRSVARVRTVCRVERDAYAAAVLVERMEQARLDQCPVWDDLCTFDGAAWRGRVDILAAGFPCQPFSAAGKRAGTDDDRWLWPDIARIVRDMEPRFVLLENVPQLLRHGAPEVLHDLAALGFDAEWGLLAASAVGAPHKRERLWIVAHRQRVGWVANLGANVARQSDDARRRTDVADKHDDGQSGVGRQSKHHGYARNDTHGCNGAVVDVGHAGSSRRSEDAGSGVGVQAPDGRRAHGVDVAERADEGVEYAPSLHEREPHRQGCAESRRDARAHPGRPGGNIPDTQDHRREDGITWRREPERPWPPRPDDHDGWADYIATGGPQPVLRRLTDGPPNGLADALHLGGNGLVPQCAAHAWGQLITRAGWSLA